MEKYIKKDDNSICVYAEPMNGLEAVEKSLKVTAGSKYDDVDGYHVQLIHDCWIPKELFIDVFQKCENSTPNKIFLDLSHKLK